MFFWEIWEWQKQMSSRFYSNKYMFLLVKVIKNLPEVAIQRYNYPKLI